MKTILVLLLLQTLFVHRARGFFTDSGRLVASKSRVDGRNRNPPTSTMHMEALSEIQSALSSGDNISEHLQEWVQLADGLLPHHLWQHSYRVIPWPLPEGGFRSQAEFCRQEGAWERKGMSIYRLNPRHNAVITVATSNVTRGGCEACFDGVTATVYKESWDWIVGSGDALDAGSTLLSDDILVEGGATYYIVLQFENGEHEHRLDPNVPQVGGILGSWDDMMASCDSFHSYSLTITYRAPLNKWAKAVESLPVRLEAYRHDSLASLSMGGCSAGAPMRVRTSDPDVWHQIVPPSSVDVVLSAQFEGNTGGIMHVLQENADRNGLRSIRCGTQGASQRNVKMKMQLEANATYYVVMDGLSSSPGDSLGSLSIETLRVPMEHSPADSVTLMPLLDDEASRSNSSLGIDPRVDHMDVCSLPYSGPPTSNAASANHLDPHQCGHSNGGRDIWYRFKPFQAMSITAEVVSESGPGGEAYMTVLYVVTPLPNGGFLQIACGDDLDNGMGSVIPQLDLRPNETYYFIVDGYLDHSTGVHTLRIHSTDDQTKESRTPSAATCPTHSQHTPLVLASRAAKDWGSACFGPCVVSGLRHGVAVMEPAPNMNVGDHNVLPATFVLQGSGGRNQTVSSSRQSSM